MENKPESETEKTTRIGSMMVATVYLGFMGALCILGPLSEYFRKRGGPGRGQ